VVSRFWPRFSPTRFQLKDAKTSYVQKFDKITTQLAFLNQHLVVENKIEAP